MLTKLLQLAKYKLFRLHYGKAILATLALLFTIGQLVPAKEIDENSNLLDKVLATFGNEVFAEAQLYCPAWLNDSGSATYSSIQDPTQTEVIISANDQWNFVPAASEHYEILLQQPKFGRLELVPEHSTIIPYYTGFNRFPAEYSQVLPWFNGTSTFTNYPQYSIQYYPNPGFLGTESFLYMNRRGNHLVPMESFDSATFLRLGSVCPKPRVNITVTGTPTLNCDNSVNRIISNSVRVESTTFEFDTLNNTAVDSFSTSNVNCDNADLSVIKQTSDSFVSGQNAVYNLTVTNNGPDDAASPITVTDTLPANMSFVSAAGTGWNCSHSSGVVTCIKADGLNNGNSSTIELTVAVN